MNRIRTDESTVNSVLTYECMTKKLLTDVITTTRVFININIIIMLTIIKYKYYNLSRLRIHVGGGNFDRYFKIKEGLEEKEFEEVLNRREYINLLFILSSRFIYVTFLTYYWSTENSFLLILQLLDCLYFLCSK